MKQGTISKLALAICLAISCAAFAGCAGGQQQGATESQKANRAYMAQVNETMVELDAQLDQFTDAVSRGDVVNMRTQADNAYKSLDKLAKIEAPEELKPIKESYVAGAEKLRTALDEYIDLYTEMSAKDSDIDKESYDERIKSIQQLYDEGVAALQQGDEKAAAGNGSSSSQSASASSQASQPSSDSSAASEPASSSEASESASPSGSSDSAESSESASSSAA